MKDLIVLTADKNTEFLIKGLLPRMPKIEEIKDFKFDIFSHPYKDPGTFKGAHDFLRPFINDYSYSLVVFDHDGCGSESKSREELEKEVESRLDANGWKDRNGVAVIDPELENWV